MEMGDIYGLLRYLGLSAESTRFFHVSYAVYLTTRQPARTPFAEWWLYPAVAGHYHTCIFNVKHSACVAVDRVWETKREALRSITKYPLKAGASSFGVYCHSCRLHQERRCSVNLLQYHVLRDARNNRHTG